MIHILRRFAAAVAVLVVAWSCVAWQRYEEAIDSNGSELEFDEEEDESSFLQVQINADGLNKARGGVEENDDFESLLQVGDVPMLVKHRQSMRQPAEPRSEVEKFAGEKHDAAPADDLESLLQVKDGPMLMQRDERSSKSRKEAGEAPAAQAEVDKVAQKGPNLDSIQGEADVITRWEAQRENASRAETSNRSSGNLPAKSTLSDPILQVLDLLTDPSTEALSQAAHKSSADTVSAQPGGAPAVTEEVWGTWKAEARAFHQAGIQAIAAATGANISNVEKMVANVSQDLISTSSADALGRHERMEKVKVALGWFSVGALFVMLAFAIAVSARRAAKEKQALEVKVPLSVRALCQDAG